MSVIPQVYNQGTGLIGSTTEGATIASTVEDLVVQNTLIVLGPTTLKDVECDELDASTIIATRATVVEVISTDLTSTDIQATNATINNITSDSIDVDDIISDSIITQELGSSANQIFSLPAINGTNQQVLAILDNSVTPITTEWKDDEIINDYVSYNGTTDKLQTNVGGTNTDITDINLKQVTFETGAIFDHFQNVYLGIRGANTSFGYNIAIFSDSHLRLIGQSVIRFYIYNAVSNASTQLMILSDSGLSVLGEITGTILNGNLVGDVTGDVVGNLTGDVVGNLTGDVVGNLTGDVVGDVTGDVVGNLTGDVVGDVTGDVVGNLTGDVVGNLTGDVTGDVTATTISAETITIPGGRLFGFGGGTILGMVNPLIPSVSSLGYQIALWSSGDIRFLAPLNRNFYYRFLVPNGTGGFNQEDTMIMDSDFVRVFKDLQLSGKTDIISDNDMNFLELDPTINGRKGRLIWEYGGYISAVRTTTSDIALVLRHNLNLVDNISITENNVYISGTTTMIDASVTGTITAVTADVTNLTSTDIIATDIVTSDLIADTATITTINADNILSDAATITTMNATNVVASNFLTSPQMSTGQLIIDDGQLLHRQGFVACAYNYIQKVTSAANIVLVDPATTFNGDYGNPTYISIPELSPIISFGRSLECWNINQYVLATGTYTTWTYGFMPRGTWCIDCKVTYQNLSTSLTHTPALKIEHFNGTTTSDISTFEPSYAQNSTGVFTCVKSRGYVYCDTLNVNVISIKTGLNKSANTNFTDRSSDMQLTDFEIVFQYFGNNVPTLL
jgi:outer membrane lipoprotein SlyB